ncbi:hypothetical protein GCM10027299_47190 [Larkinella ripae]
MSSGRKRVYKQGVSFSGNALWYYRSKKYNLPVIDKLRVYAETHPTRGFDEYYGKIRIERLSWNHKRA